ncbi:hypothetical protein [Actinoplanes sp. CA-252034]
MDPVSRIRRSGRRPGVNRRLDPVTGDRAGAQLEVLAANDRYRAS